MIRVNLLKPEKKEFKEGFQTNTEKAKEKKKPDYSKAAVIFAVILIAGLSYTQRHILKKEQGLLQKTQEEKQKLLYVFSKLEELERQKSLYEKKINLIEQLKSEQGAPVRVMDGLSEEIPSWVWLTQSIFDNNTIQIKGKALSNSSIADYISNMEINPYFDEVNLIASVQNDVKNTEIHEFSLTARYTLNQETHSQKDNAENEIKGKKK